MTPSSTLQDQHHLISSNWFQAAFRVPPSSLRVPIMTPPYLCPSPCPLPLSIGKPSPASSRQHDQAVSVLRPCCSDFLKEDEIGQREMPTESEREVVKRSGRGLLRSRCCYDDSPLLTSRTSLFGSLGLDPSWGHRDGELQSPGLKATER